MTPASSMPGGAERVTSGSSATPRMAHVDGFAAIASYRGAGSSLTGVRYSRLGLADIMITAPAVLVPRSGPCPFYGLEGLAPMTEPICNECGATLSDRTADTLTAHLAAEHPERFEPLSERLDAVVRDAERPAPSGPPSKGERNAPVPVRVKVGAVADLPLAGSAYGIGLDDDGHRIEFLGDWRAMRELRDALDGPEPVYASVESWQVLAFDGALRVDLSREAMVERAAFLRSALARMEAPE